jgi:hypothetical protein
MLATNVEIGRINDAGAVVQETIFSAFPFLTLKS